MMATNENAPIESLIKSFMLLLLSVMFFKNQKYSADRLRRVALDVKDLFDKEIF
jgi:hypothetical protein